MTTFYAGTYHGASEGPSTIGGIIIDGQYNPFSGWISPSQLPAHAHCWSQTSYNGGVPGNPDGVALRGVYHYQTFTSAFEAGDHTLDFSRSTAVESL